MLSGVIDLARYVAQSIVDLLELRLEALHVLAHRCEAVLDVPQLVGVGSIVASHALEVPREKTFLTLYFIEGSACIVLESLELPADLRQVLLHLLGEVPRLLQVRAPFFATLLDLAEL